MQRSLIAIGAAAIIGTGAFVLFGRAPATGRAAAAAGAFLANIGDAAARTLLARPAFLADIPIGGPTDSGNGAAAPAATGTPAHGDAGTAAPCSPVITEVLMGTDKGGTDEFVELWNPYDTPIDLAGWTVKKRSAAGKESALVAAARFEGKTVPPRSHFLMANEGGYAGEVPADVLWPRSATLAYAENAVIVYNKEGKPVAEVSWDKVPKGRSIGRDNGDSPFALQTPDPENSRNE